ncbi:MAG: PorP/SprF family type IX secretion system membrane protein [Bacteroidales bacterium]|nr:PorP/SprF family type IX secretion system membrane protein [Bacteroidales bacterium]MCF8390637.1 PorP/SprF family type IX secretion system membrane protein [Bacteroidales bacterium]
MSGINKTIFIIFFIFSCFISEAQETPVNPVSNKIFSSYIFNPAITGSKDFASVSTIASFQDGFSSQILTADARLSKKASPYLYSNTNKEFGNIGVGGSVFNDRNGASKNIGASTSVSYHIPLNKNKLSFLSFGAAVKGVQNTMDYGVAGDSLINPGTEETFFPNLDFGVYLYGPGFYAGFSATNLLGNPGIADSLGVYEIPVSQQSFFLAGYKILISKSLNIILEPSVIITSKEFNFELERGDIQPIIRLYLQDFCMGMYFNDSDKNSFFFQYNYPGFYLGAYFGIPQNTVFYLNKPIIELSAGINLSRENFKVKHPVHW